MLITTNEYFQDKSIEKYLGQVNEQIVIGANIFKDVFASFRDVFGGETKGYKKELNKLKKAAIKGLQKKASEKGANGVIGYRMDLDEISGGGKSMFMLNVFGTAVQFKESTDSDAGEVSADELEYQVKRLGLKEAYNNGERIKLDTLIEYELDGFIKEAFENYKPHETKSRKRLLQYLSIVPGQEIESFLDAHIQELEQHEWDIMLEGLMDRGWFNVDFILELLRNKNTIIRFRGLHLCSLGKDHYRRKDLESLKKLSRFLDNDFNTAIELEVEEGTFSSSEKWTCPRCLRQNKKSSETCSCGADQFGFEHQTFEELTDQLNKKIQVLESHFASANS